MTCLLFIDFAGRGPLRQPTQSGDRVNWPISVYPTNKTCEHRSGWNDTQKAFPDTYLRKEITRTLGGSWWCPQVVHLMLQRNLRAQTAFSHLIGRHTPSLDTPPRSNTTIFQDVEQYQLSWELGREKLKFRKSPRRSGIILYWSFVRLEYFQYIYLL